MANLGPFLNSTASLPPIDARHLHKEFGQYGARRGEPTPGPGGKTFDQLIRVWNAGNYERAFDLLTEAIQAGLEDVDRAAAHCLLGQIQLTRNRVPEAVQEFLRCLEIPKRPKDQTWQAAMRLYYIYNELGRSAEGHGVLEVAKIANQDLNWAHASELVRDVQEKARRWAGTESPRPAVDAAAAEYKSDLFISTCLEVEYEECKDDRWFSQFKELPQIDSLRKNGNPQEALSICRKGLQQYPDSFLFYLRAADILDQLGRGEESERMLTDGLRKSLSKCSIAARFGDRAFEKSADGRPVRLRADGYRVAIRWWITACVLQLKSKLLVDTMPFLNLAYVCQPIGIKNSETWLLTMADRASSQGPIRFDAGGAELRHQVARAAMAAGDGAAQHAIVAFHERYK